MSVRERRAREFPRRANANEKFSRRRRDVFPHVLFRGFLPSRFVRGRFGRSARLQRALDSIEITKVHFRVAQEFSFRRLVLPFVDQALYLRNSIQFALDPAQVVELSFRIVGFFARFREGDHGEKRTFEARGMF